MFAAIVAALPFLAPLLKTGSLQAAKWVAGGILLLSMCLFSGYVGYRWELSDFEKYKTKSANHELRIQKQYDQIGSELEAKYEAEQAASEAETQRQLQELGNVQVRAPGKLTKLPPANRKLRNPPAPGNSDTDRIVRVLRSAAGGKQ